jgi:hypothetical protein
MSRDTIVSFDKCAVHGNGRVDFTHNCVHKMLRFSTENTYCICGRAITPQSLCLASTAKNCLI